MEDLGKRLIRETTVLDAIRKEECFVTNTNFRELSLQKNMKEGSKREIVVDSTGVEKTFLILGTVHRAHFVQKNPNNKNGAYTIRIGVPSDDTLHQGCGTAASFAHMKEGLPHLGTNLIWPKADDPGVEDDGSIIHMPFSMKYAEWDLTARSTLVGVAERWVEASKPTDPAMTSATTSTEPNTEVIDTTLDPDALHEEPQAETNKPDEEILVGLDQLLLWAEGPQDFWGGVVDARKHRYTGNGYALSGLAYHLPFEDPMSYLVDGMVVCCEFTMEAYTQHPEQGSQQAKKPQTYRANNLVESRDSGGAKSAKWITLIPQVLYVLQDAKESAVSPRKKRQLEMLAKYCPPSGNTKRRLRF